MKLNRVAVFLSCALLSTLSGDSDGSAGSVDSIAHKLIKSKEQSLKQLINECISDLSSCLDDKLGLDDRLGLLDFNKIVEEANVLFLYARISLQNGSKSLLDEVSKIELPWHDNNPELDYRNSFNSYISGLLSKIPRGYMPIGFMDEYFNDFFESYFEDFRTHHFLPNAVIIVDKSKVCRKDKPETEGCKRSYYAYYFNFNSEKTQPEAIYEVGIGRDSGDTYAETKGDVRITPEGIFWIDEMVSDPIIYYEKVFEKDTKKKGIGKYYGPRLIGLKTPSSRNRLDGLIAFHGTTKEAQWTIGKTRSFGCLRMYNSDVINFYKSLQQQENKGVGTVVVITP